MGDDTTSPKGATQRTADCPLCSGTGRATGAQQKHADGRTFLELECEDCHHVFDAWKRDWDIRP